MNQTTQYSTLRIAATLLCLVFCVLTVHAQANILSVRDDSVTLGDTATISIDMDNASPVVALQFSLTMPDGIVPDATSIALTGRADGHSVMMRHMDDGKWMVMAFSGANKPFKASSGAVLTFKALVDTAFVEGTVHTVSLAKVILSAANGDNVLTSSRNGSITIRPTFDLAVSDITSSRAALSPGDTVTIGWRIANSGQVMLSGGWKEQVYLTDSQGGSRLLGTLSNDGDLAPGATAARTADIVLPQIVGLDGASTISVKATALKGHEALYRLSNNEAASSAKVAVSRRLYVSPASATFSEGSSVRLILTRSGSTASDEVFTVSHTADSRLSVPQTVTVSRGQSAAYVHVSSARNGVWDDHVADTVTISSNSYGFVSVPLSITDDTQPQLTLSSPQIDVTEGGTLTLVVKTPKPVRDDLALTLTCDLASRFSIPSGLVIKAGSDSTVAEVKAIDDDTPDVEQVVTFRASASGYASATMLTTLVDDDVPSLRLSLSPRSVSEGAGPLSVTATITRTDKIDKNVTVRLSDNSNGGIFYSQQTITMAPGVTQTTVNLGPVDNSIVDGERHYTISAGVWISSCSCNAGTSGGTVTDSITVYDNDGPTLTLTSASSAIREGGAMTVTVERNTDGSGALAVVITSDHASDLEYPDTVTIADGATSVSFTVRGKSNTVTGDSFTAMLTASADGYSKAALYFSVTDQTLPDAQITAISLSKNSAEAGTDVDVTLTLANTGMTALPETTPVSITLSGTEPVTAYLQDSLAAGAAVTIQRTLTLPSRVGSFNVYATANADRKVRELSYTNNTSSVLTVTTVSPYTFTLATDKALYGAADSVAISGTVTGSDVAAKTVDVYVINEGYRHVIKATTDGEGHFAVTYKPYSGQIGYFAVGACYPGEGLSTSLASFNILGLRRSSMSAITCEPTVGEVYNSTFGIVNPASVPLTGARATVISKPDNWDANVSMTSVISGRSDVSFSLRADAASEGSDWEQIQLNIETAEGVSLPVTLYCYSRTPKGKLRTETSSINTSMTKGQMREYPVTITNVGKGETGAISLSLPSWMTTSTPTEMASLATGESATVVLQFTPTSDMQLNVPVSGRIGINCATGDGLAIPYYIEPVSDTTGVLVFDVCDEYTYYTKEAPHLSGATVTVKHPATGAVVATGKTGTDGTYSVTLPEGWYAVTVSADRHDTYSNNLEVAPGRYNRTTVNLSVSGVTVDWSVEETEVRDEYNIITTVKYEVNVPVPVVELVVPDKVAAKDLPEGESLVFYATLTNKGLITAKDVELQLPTGFTSLVFEALDHTEPFDLAPLQSVRIPVKVTHSAATSSAKGMMRAGNLDNDPCASQVGTLYYWDCGKDRKWHRYGVALQLGSCGHEDVPNLNPDTEVTGPSGPTISWPSVIGPARGPVGGGSGGYYTYPNITQPLSSKDDPGCEPCQNGILRAGGKCLGHFVGDAMETLKSLMGMDDGSDDDDDDDDDNSQMSLDDMLDGVYDLLEGIASTFDECVGAASSWHQAYVCYKTASETVDKLFDESISSTLGVFLPAEKVKRFKRVGKKMLKWKSIIDNLAECAKDFRHACDDVNNDDTVTPASAKGATPRKARSTDDYISSITGNMGVIADRIDAFSTVNDIMWGTGEGWDDLSFADMEVLMDSVDYTTQSFDDVLKFKPEAISKEQFRTFFENRKKYLAGDVPQEVSDRLSESILTLHQTRQHFDSLGYDNPAKYTNEMLPKLMDYVNGRRSSVCSSITLQLSQQMVMTRQAFRGTLTVHNGSGDTAMTGVRLNLTVTDSEGNVATSHEFQTTPESLVGFEGDLDLGSAWSLAADGTGTATILFIPTRYAAVTTPEPYSFGGTMSYVDPFTGLEVTRDLTPVTLTVKPSPVLDLTYFMQRDVLGDDPLTEEVEPMEEAEFALLMHNTGYGDATNVSFTTNQPQIVDNEKGLAVKFTLTGSSLNGSGKTLALGGSTVTDFGTVPARGTAYAQWRLTSTLLGHFTSYDVEATHVTSYDNPDLSLLGNVTIHELIRSISTGDSIVGFLANDLPDEEDLPDVLYLSNGDTAEVHTAAGDAVRNSASECVLTVTPSSEGWNYASVPSPMPGKAALLSVIRQSDGRALSLRNVWLTDRTLRDGKEPVYENRIHIADDFASASPETYILTFTQQPDTVLAVDSIMGVPAEGTVLAQPLRQLTVKFNKAVDASTFTAADLTLTVQGVEQPTDSVAIAAVDNSTFTLDLSKVSAGNGYYVLTVQTAGITDIDGYAGKTGKMVGWTLYSGGKVRVTVTVEPAEAGSVVWMLPAEAAEVDYGTTVILQAGAASGYIFSNWTLDGEVIGSEATVAQPALADMAIVANFIEDTATGIDSIAIGPDGCTVYNLQGGIVLRHADRDALRRLPKGVYIVSGRKLVID